MGADFIMGATELPPADLDLDLLGYRLTTRLLADSALVDDLRGALGDDEITTSELATHLRGAVEAFRSGVYDRQIDTLDTFTADGRQRTLTVSGHLSWGDLPDAVEALLLLSLLPEQWWAA